MTAITCAWCGEPATTEIEIKPAGTVMIETPQGKRSVLRPAKRAYACDAHANPAERQSAPRARGPIKGQTTIYDALGDEAA